jgi:hypothetical protein
MLKLDNRDVKSFLLGYSDAFGKYDVACRLSPRWLASCGFAFDYSAYPTCYIRGRSDMFSR